jgi:O-antigen/teichoic acid export membrane protein
LSASAERPADPAAAGGSAGRQLASGTRILSVGIASTGLFTFAYLAFGANLLTPADYSRVSICWAIMYVILSVIYRPVEQLLSRTIADRRARGETSARVLRVPALLQASFATIFLALALTLQGPLVHGLFKGSRELFWILVIGVLAYAASYFVRGWLAGHQRFALYGGLVFLESTSRFSFAVVAVIAVGAHLGAVGLGMAVAPFASLLVIPLAFGRLLGRGRRRPPSPSAPRGAGAPEIELVDAALASGPGGESTEAASADLSLRHGSGFAVAVVAIMASEQTLMNAGVLIVALGRGGGDITNGLAGFVFNVLLIVRAPLQLFQAVQTSILPHLTSMEVAGSATEFARAVKTTLRAIAAFAALVSLGLLSVGPFVMSHLLQSHAHHAAHVPWNRYGLALVGIGMGMHLCAGTFNQALLARGRPGRAALSWLTAAVVFVLFVALPTVGAGHDAQVWRVEVGYLLATTVLAGLLALAYRASGAPAGPAPAPTPPPPAVGVAAQSA